MHMDLRALEPGDEDHVREIAHDSLETSYADVLPAAVIDEAVDRWYAPERIEAYLADEEMGFVVAEIDDRPVGFGQAHVIEELGKGRVLWIHVSPDHRGAGIGADILEELLDRMHDRGIETATAVVLAEYDPGIAFYEAHGFARLADRTVEIGGESFRELILREETASPPPLELRVNEDGEEFFVDLEESDRGSRSPFCAVYRDPDREHRYGWFCTWCESFHTSMDTMGRIQCTQCENTRKPTRWDAAYL